MTPPRLDGHDQSLDPYSSGPRWTGNVAKARAELRLCGQPNGFSTKMVYDLLSKTDPKLFAAERAALGRVGITLIRWKLPLTGTFVFTGSPQQLKEFGIGLAENSGPPDYSTAYALYKPLAYRPNALPDGLVFSLYTDPAVQRILDGRPKSIMAWTNLDRAVMDSALYLPVMWPKVLEYRNPRMTNVTCDLALASGIYDFVNVGVR
jgi:peptide/nickel transport system substrate-binding protein